MPDAPSLLTTPPLHAAAHPLPRAAAWPFGPSSHPRPSVCRRHAGNTSVARWSRAYRAPAALPKCGHQAPRKTNRVAVCHRAPARLRAAFLSSSSGANIPARHGAPSTLPSRYVTPQAAHLRGLRTPVIRTGTSHPRLSSPARARRAQRAACHPRLSVPHSPSLPRPLPSRAFAHAPCSANARPTNRSHVRARPSSDVSRETSVPAV